MDNQTVMIIAIAALIIIVGIAIMLNSKKPAPVEPKKEDLVAMGRLGGTGVRRPEAASSAPVRTATAGQPVTKPEPEKEIPVDPRSADERYAAARDLWICKYCESLNPYPAGMEPSKLKAAAQRKSSLRGQLAGKSKPAAPAVPQNMKCIACGKQHL